MKWSKIITRIYESIRALSKLCRPLFVADVKRFPIDLIYYFMLVHSNPSRVCVLAFSTHQFIREILRSLRP